ncbi:MAG: cbb3-type cytochrome oxidase assembly protein CcoS [Porticoccaceae bacterium]
MESFYLFIPLSLITLALVIGVFFWAVNSGQYDDLDREADRILFDDQPAPGKDAPGDEETPESPDGKDGND